MTLVTRDVEQLLAQWRLQSRDFVDVLTDVDSSASEAIERIVDQSEDLTAWRSRLARTGVWGQRVEQLARDAAKKLGVSREENRSRFAPRKSACVEEDLHLMLAGNLDNSGPTTRPTKENGLPPLPGAIESLANYHFQAASISLSSTAAAVCKSISRLATNECINLLKELHEVLLPALVTELHVARAKGLLRAKGKEGFDEFCEEILSSREWLADLFVAYPVLLRLVSERVRAARAHWSEVIERFAVDVHAMIEGGLIAAQSPIRIEEISQTGGDRHRSGRRVSLVSLSGGQRVVYKPRSLGIDVAYAKFVHWLNAHGCSPKLGVPLVLVRDAYGWVEFIETKPCENIDQVEQFYCRQGAHLAVLYLLGGYDFFSENVIASGGTPYLIDLECVHSPKLPSVNGSIFESTARDYLDESVNRAGLLPAWSWSQFGRDGVNLSSLTSIDGQLTPLDIVDWENLGSDDLRQTKRRKEIHSSYSHLPELDGRPYPVNNYLETLFGGFESAYRLILLHKKDLLSDGSGLHQWFAGAECRLVIRNTMDYSTFLSQSYHPRYVKNAFAYGAFLDRLWGSECARYSPEVLHSECAQLAMGDIPVFVALADEQHLRDHTGAVVAENYLTETALAGALRRLERWSDVDCQKQLEIMRTAFAITEAPHVASAFSGIVDSAEPELAEDDTSLPAEALLRESCHLGEVILSLSIEDDRSLTWLGLGQNRAGQWEQTSLDSSLYDGAPGIGLYLLYLSEFAGHKNAHRAFEIVSRFVGGDAAREALKNRSRLQDWIVSQNGAFDFPFSSLYLHLHANSFARSESLEALLDLSLEWAKIGLTRKPRYDFLTGAAGLVRLLVVTYRETGVVEAIRLATKYGELLERAAIPVAKGVGWPNEQFPTLLGGFSHGASGIAWALSDLALASGDERFLSLADKALHYDRTLFSADSSDWYDLRYSSSERGSAVQWCHGVSGIALSRVLMMDSMGANWLESDVRTASSQILAEREVSDCLCHGTLGNLDVCSLAAERLRDASLRTAVARKANTVFRSAQRRGVWRSGLPNRNVGLTGLFMGTAGIGYGLLRLAFPLAIPSVLYLGSPNQKRLASQSETLVCRT